MTSEMQTESDVSIDMRRNSRMRGGQVIGSLSGVIYAKPCRSAKEIYMSITQRRLNQGMAKIFGLEDEDDDFKMSDDEKQDKVETSEVIVHKNAYSKCVYSIQKRFDELNIPIYSIGDPKKH